MNPAFEQLAGLDASTARGKTIREVLPHTENRWIEAYGSVVRTGEPLAFETYAQELDRYFDVRAFPHDPGRVGVVMTDITDRIRATDQLRERTASLDERVRELECLYRVASLCGERLTSLPATLQRIVATIPSGFQRSDRVCSTIRVGEREYRSSDFDGESAVISSPVRVEGREVGYVSAATVLCEGVTEDNAFLPEERALLDAIGRIIGNLVDFFPLNELQDDRSHDQ